MTKTLTIIPVVVACALIVVVTVIQGRWTQRWSDVPEKQMMELADRYDGIPMNFGNWVGENLEQSSRELDRAGAKANVSRRYRNAETGQIVSVYLICGYSRHVSVHTPEACYVGRGHLMERRPVVRRLNTGPERATLKTSTFLKEHGENAAHQRILWGWTNNGQWDAPESPRWKYGGRAILNKVYLISAVPSGRKETIEDSAAFQFGEEFLPLVSQALYPKDTLPQHKDTGGPGSTEEVATASGP